MATVSAGLKPEPDLQRQTGIAALTADVLPHTGHAHLHQNDTVRRLKEGGGSPGGKDECEQHEAHLDGEYCRGMTKKSNIG